LRTVKQRVEPSIQDEIKNLIKQDEVETAMERLSDFLSSEGRQEALDDLYAQMGRWESNKKALRRKTITEESAGIEKNRIVDWLLATTSEVFA
jgi:hypothetical protein